jgi:hypothetical protein
MERQLEQSDNMSDAKFNILLDMMAKQKAEYEEKLREKDKIISILLSWEGLLPAGCNKEAKMCSNKSEGSSDGLNVGKEAAAVIDGAVVSAAQFDTQNSAVSAELREVRGDLNSVLKRLSALEFSTVRTHGMPSGDVQHNETEPSQESVCSSQPTTIEFSSQYHAGVMKVHNDEYPLIGRNLSKWSTWVFPRYLNEGPGPNAIYPRNALEAANMTESQIEAFYKWYGMINPVQQGGIDNRRLATMNWINSGVSWCMNDQEFSNKTESNMLGAEEGDY